ncbi:ABC transporter substrate-binding protein [Limoniibacter endophyticus]|nr:ABC transporter substrate-binding protein [Limoniibacter endophyticus]
MLKFGTLLASALLVSMATLGAKAETFVLGAYPSNPPWEFKNERGQFEGFEIDVAQEVVKRLGMELEISDLGFQALFAATSSGRIDGAVSSISINNDRLQTQSFTQPYYDSDGTIVGREASDIASLEDLKDKTIGVVAATTGAKWAEENREKYGIGNVTSYSAQQDLLLDVRNGRIDGGAGELAGFQYAMTKTPGLKILVRIPTGERFAMMMKKDHPLLEKVNAALTEMKQDGTMIGIHKKWFGVEPTPDTSTVTPSDLPKAQ